MARTPCKRVPPWVFEFGRKAVEERHGIDLGLVAQPYATVERERHIGALDPLCAIEAGFSAGREYGFRGADAVRPRGVRVVVFALHVETVVLGVPQQPIAPFRLPVT